MAVDMFLKLDGIPGESKDAKHKDEIDVYSWSWGISVPIATGGGGGASGRATPKELVVVKEIDKSTPILMKACCEGQHIQGGTLTLVNKETRLEYLKIKMTDILISNYQTGGSNAGGAIPVDQISFNFSQINVQALDKRGGFEEMNCNFSKDIFVKEQAHNHDK